MRKLLLTLALLVFGCGTKAQVMPIKNNDIPHAVSMQKNIILPKDDVKKKKTFVKGVAEGTTLICDFSDVASFSVGTTAWNSVAGTFSGWFHKADTMSVITACENSDYFTINSYLDLSGTGYTDILQNMFEMSAYNGFAYIDMISSWLCDGQNVNNLDAYIKFNTPVYTYGKRGIDIYLNQFCYKFNYDRYFIDWSHSEDFSVYDSIEFNIRNIDVASGKYIGGQKIVNIPVGTENCNVISSDPDEQTYFRIRVKSDASMGQPHGYFYLIDDISWAETPQTRVEIISAKFTNGYNLVPSIVTPDNLNMQITLRNTGASDITDAQAISHMFYLTSDENGEQQSEYVGLSASDIETLPAGYYNDTIFADLGSVSQSISQINTYNAYSLITNSNPQVTSKGVGSYMATRGYQYKTSEGEPVANNEVAYPTYYNVVDSIDGGLYRWARDCGSTVNNSNVAFKKGLTQDSYGVWLTDYAAYNQRGYKVCVAYNASAFQESVYARGAELVLAPDVCSEGARIKASLWYYDTEATDVESMVKPVSDNNGEAVESSVYTLTANDLNSVVYEPYQILYAGTDLKAIYLPFQSTVLQPDVDYYVCYENVTNGEFAVAQEGAYGNIFGARSRQVIVYTPAVSTGQYPWGMPFSYDQCPMIRFMVSNTSGDTVTTTPEEPSITLSEPVFTEQTKYPFPGMFSVNVTIEGAENCDKYSWTITNDSLNESHYYNVGQLYSINGQTPVCGKNLYFYGDSKYFLYARVICGDDTVYLKKEFTTPSSSKNGIAFTSINVSGVTDTSVSIYYEMNDNTVGYYSVVGDFSELENYGIHDKNDIINTNDTIPYGTADKYYQDKLNIFVEYGQYHGGNTVETYYFPNTVEKVGIITLSFNGNNYECDVDFKVVTLSSITEQEDVTVCGGYVINGEYITQSGQYTDYENGKKVNLTVLPSYDSIVEVTVCAGESYTFAGQTYNTTGVYKDQQTGINGCDSTVTLYLTVLPEIEKNVTVAICEGDKYQFGDELLSQAGVYTKTLQSTGGCDSVVNLTLVYLPSYDTVIEATICPGTSYTLNGFNEDKEGVYTKKHSSVTCCDSVVTLILHVSNTITNDYYITICDGNTYEFNGEVFSTSGDYTYTVDNGNGCDSVYTLHLTVLAPIDTVIYDSIAEGEYVVFGGDTLTESGTYTKTFLSESNCDSTVTLILKVGSVGLYDAESTVNTFNVYPNPAKDFVTLDLGHLALDGADAVVIFNSKGQVVYKSNIQSQKSNISLKDFESGVYYIKVGNITKKLVVE